MHFPIGSLWASRRRGYWLCVLQSVVIILLGPEDNSHNKVAECQDGVCPGVFVCVEYERIGGDDCVKLQVLDQSEDGRNTIGLTVTGRHDVGEQ